METFLKRVSLLLALLCIAVSSVAQPIDIKFYMPEEVSNFKSSIPTPKDLLGYEVGEQHVTYDQILSYMRLLASKSDRVRIIESGYSYEKRPMLYLIISSPENLANLESIRTKHLDLCNPEKSANINVKGMPMITWMGHRVLNRKVLILLPDITWHDRWYLPDLEIVIKGLPEKAENFVIIT